MLADDAVQHRLFGLTARVRLPRAAESSPAGVLGQPADLAPRVRRRSAIESIAAGHSARSGTRTVQWAHQ